MNIEEFKNKLKNTPETIQFSETINTIEANYNFTPTAFKNGTLQNAFGQFYFDEVLKDPNGDGHQNIRNFMNTGFEGVSFEGTPLKMK